MPSTDPFDNPGTTARIDWADLLGRLLLITAESEETVQTAYGESKPVRASVVVVDGPNGPEEYADTLIFPRILAGQVRGNIGTGRMNLGRVGQGNAKNGQSAPWILQDPTDTDRAIARNYLSNTQVPF